VCFEGVPLERARALLCSAAPGCTRHVASPVGGIMGVFMTSQAACGSMVALVVVVVVVVVVVWSALVWSGLVCCGMVRCGGGLA